MNETTEPRWIRFTLYPPSTGRVTRQWRVETRDGQELLGVVRWYSGWRKYVFYPNAMTLFEQDCLRDIAAFLERETAAHKAERSRLAS